MRLTRFTNIRFVVVIAFVAALALSTSGLATSAQTAANGRLRFVHGVPDATAVDVTIDKAVAVRALEFGTASRFLSVPAGEHTVIVTPAGDAAAKPLLQAKVTVGPAQAQTVIAQGTAAAPEAGVYEDDLGPSAFGNARFTATHAIKGAPSVDVLKADGAPLIQGLAYGAPYGGFDPVAGLVDVAVVPAGSNVSGALIKAEKLPLIAGTQNRLVVMGTVEKPSYVLLTAAADAEDPANSALIRLVHASPDAPAVDIYAGDKLIAPSVAFGGFTPHIALTAGSVDISVRAAGSPSATAPLTKSAVTLAAGKALTAVIAGPADSPVIQTAEDNIAVLAPNKARLNVINASGEGMATVKVGSASIAAAGAKTDPKGTEVDPGNYDIAATVDSPALQLAEKVTISGGVLYDVILAGNDKASKLIVAATGLSEQPGSAPGVEVALAPTTPAATEPPTQPPAVQTQAPTEPPAAATQAPPPTAVPTQPPPPTAVAQEPTATLEPPPTIPPQPTVAQGIIATVNTNEGVNLKIREYPRIDARTLALAPSGTALIVSGVMGRAAPAESPTPTQGAATREPTATRSAEGVAVENLWLFITWNQGDGGTVTGWVNAQYVDITRNGRPVREVVDILSFREIPADQNGEFKTTAITPVAADPNNIIGTITVDEGRNLQLRRTPGIDGESLALVPSGAQVIVIEKTDIPPKGFVGEPTNPTWLFVRYETESGAVVGWLNLQFVKLSRRDRPLEIGDVPVAKEIQRGFLTGNATAVKPPSAPGIVALVDKVNPGVNLQLRREPKADAESLALVPAGTELPVLGRSGDGNWLNVRFADKEGWINSQFVTITKSGKPVKIEEITIITGETDSTTLATPGPSPTATPTAIG